MTRRFKLVRNTDVTGVSGTGHVADGLAFDDGVVVLRWRSEWPTSVVFHDRGIEAVEKIHGHGGATRIQWLDIDGPPQPAVTYADLWTTLKGYVQAAIENPSVEDAKAVLDTMHRLEAHRCAPIKAWMDGIREQPAAAVTPPATREER